MNDQVKETRPTDTITLPSGLVVEHYTYIKAKDMLALNDSKDSNRSLYESIVVSIDGSKENVYDRLIDLSYQEYKIVDSLIMKIIKGEYSVNALDDEEKKTSLTNTSISSEQKEVAQVEVQ